MPDIKKYLNRDGLDEYNSLLPHSGAAMQAYVNDWLDEHPEATTTVQDGAITEPKLADKSVSLRTLADNTVHMLKGAILTGNLSSEVLTADDSYSAPPVALTVEGKSTQDGTPTPDAPVEIVSLEQVNLTFAGKNLFDISKVIRTSANVTVDGTKITTVGGSSDIFTGSTGVSSVVADLSKVMYLPAGTYTISCGKTDNSTVALYRVAYDGTVETLIASSASITSWVATFTLEAATYITIRGTNQTITNLQIEAGNVATAYVPFDSLTNVLLNLTQALRSLPDGTHDSLSFAYLRPSTRDGWAWFTPTRVVNIGITTVNDVGWTRYNSTGFYSSFYNVIRKTVTGKSEFMSTFFAPETTTSLAGTGSKPVNTIFGRNSEGQAIVHTATGYASAAEFKAAYADATILYALATPITTQLDPVELPFTTAPNFTIWNNPNTGLQIEYVRDSNLVIQRIEEAIADQ